MTYIDYSLSSLCKLTLDLFFNSGEYSYALANEIFDRATKAEDITLFLVIS